MVASIGETITIFLNATNIVVAFEK